MDIFRKTERGIEYGDEFTPTPKPTLLRRIVTYIGGAFVFLAIALMVAVAIIEFMVGCGEVTYHANGTWETNQCVFLTTKYESGTW